MASLSTHRQAVRTEYECVYVHDLIGMSEPRRNALPTGNSYRCGFNMLRENGAIIRILRNTDFDYVLHIWWQPNAEVGSSTSSTFRASRNEEYEGGMKKK